MENKEEKIDLSLDELMMNAAKLSPKVLSDLEKYFDYDYTVEQACTEVGINPDTYYEWCKRSEEFATLMKSHKNQIRLKAKRIIYDQIESNDPDAAKFILERTEKGIYSSRSEVTGPDGDPLNSGTETALVSIADSLNKILDNEIPPTSSGGSETNSTPPVQE